MWKKFGVIALAVVGFGFAFVSAANAGTEVIRDYGNQQQPTYNYARPLPPPPRPVYYAPPPPVYFSIFPAYGYYGPRFGYGYHRFYGHRPFVRRHF